MRQLDGTEGTGNDGSEGDVPGNNNINGGGGEQKAMEKTESYEIFRGGNSHQSKSSSGTIFSMK